MNRIGQIQNDRQEASESRGETQRQHEAVESLHLQVLGTRGAEAGPGLGNLVEEEQEEDNIGNEDDQVPDTEQGVSDGHVENNFAVIVIFDQVRMEEDILKERILRGAAGTQVNLFLSRIISLVISK